jgi:two-component system sensor histidine kinase CpxA
MNEMIGRLLNLTRLETEASDIERFEFDLCQLLHDVVQDADFEAQSRNRQVTLDAAGPLLFKGSRELLKQALENVVRNAVRYTAAETGVEVSLQEVQGQVEIKIADRGPGVPEEALEKLFDPFYRVADARDRESGGTGIGLAIAERAVKLHKGRITALNRPGGGLAVEIMLPSELKGLHELQGPG